PLERKIWGLTHRRAPALSPALSALWCRLRQHRGREWVILARFRPFSLTGRTWFRLARSHHLDVCRGVEATAPDHRPELVAACELADAPGRDAERLRDLFRGQPSGEWSRGHHLTQSFARSCGSSSRPPAARWPTGDGS